MKGGRKGGETRGERGGLEMEKEEAGGRRRRETGDGEKRDGGVRGGEVGGSWRGRKLGEGKGKGKGYLMRVMRDDLPLPPSSPLLVCTVRERPRGAPRCDPPGLWLTLSFFFSTP